MYTHGYNQLKRRVTHIRSQLKRGHINSTEADLLEERAGSEYDSRVTERFQKRWTLESK